MRGEGGVMQRGVGGGRALDAQRAAERGARLAERRIQIAGGQHTRGLPHHQPQELRTRSVELARDLARRRAGQQQLQRARPAALARRRRRGSLAHHPPQLWRRDGAIERASPQLEQPRQEGPAHASVRSGQAAHEGVDHSLPSPVAVIQQLIAGPQLQRRRLAIGRLRTAHSARQLRQLRLPAAATCRGKACAPVPRVGGALGINIDDVAAAAAAVACALSQQDDLEPVAPWSGAGRAAVQKVGRGDDELRFTVGGGLVGRERLRSTARSRPRGHGVEAQRVGREADEHPPPRPASRSGARQTHAHHATPKLVDGLCLGPCRLLYAQLGCHGGPRAQPLHCPAHKG